MRKPLKHGRNQLERDLHYPAMVPERHHRAFGSLAALIVSLIFAVGCGSTEANLAALDYAPLAGGDWAVPAPQEQGLDPRLVAESIADAAELDSIQSLLVVRNGFLDGEGYFNAGSAEEKALLASVSKSCSSTLIGNSIEQGYLTGLDQMLVDYYREYADRVVGPRKRQITIRHLLLTRSGYPREETHPDLFEAMWTGDYPPLIVHFPLTADPGTTFPYRHTMSAWLADIVSRSATGNSKLSPKRTCWSQLAPRWVTSGQTSMVNITRRFTSLRRMPRDLVCLASTKADSTASRSCRQTGCPRRSRSVRKMCG